MLRRIMFYKTIILVFLFTVNAGSAQVKLAPSERRNERDGAIQVYVPPGEYIMGIDDPEMPYEDAERPPHPVKITNGFWMDKYEITNEQFAGFLNKLLAGEVPVAKIHKFSKDCTPKQVLDMLQAQVDFNHPFCGLELAIDQRVVRVKPGWENLPVMPVTWSGARQYCETMGKRLPTEAEWEYAARGAAGRKYPWGNEWHVDWANVGTGKPAPVGSYPKDISPFGVMDMAGNVREWVFDKFDVKYYSESPRNAPCNYTGAYEYVKRVIRGGGFAFTEWDSRTTSRGNRAYTSYPVGTGFRCAESGPPPSGK